jgi:DNA-binding NarL/FixJ family response regulator
VAAASNARDGLFEANRHYWDLAVLDLRLGTESGVEWLTALRGAYPWRSCRYAGSAECESVFQNAMVQKLISFILKSLVSVVNFPLHIKVLFSVS